MILPTIHLNGTSAESLADAYQGAAYGLRCALERLHDAAPNARDYYPQGPDAFRAAEREHLARIERVRAVLAEIGELYEHAAEVAP